MGTRALRAVMAIKWLRPMELLTKENSLLFDKKEPFLMFKKILIAFVVVVVIFVGIVMTRPDDFRVMRSTSIQTSSDVVFAQVNDFHKWEAWSPWAKLDPEAKLAFEGPAEGEGAIFGGPGIKKWERGI
jgi:hypothetical protein